MTAVRIDRWLWAARFYKTRSLAKSAVEGGKVHIDGQRVKPSKEVRVGVTLTIRKNLTPQIVVVNALSDQRGPASVAQLLYTETNESIEMREAMLSQRRMERAGLNVPGSKPDKKDRRALSRLKSLHDEWDSSSNN